MNFLEKLKNFNFQMLFTALKAALLAIGPTVIAIMPMLGYAASDGERFVALATSIIGGILLLIEKTKAAMAIAAAGIKGTQVHVDPLEAPASVVAAVKTTPDLVPMGPGGPVPSDLGKLG